MLCKRMSVGYRIKNLLWIKTPEPSVYRMSHNISLRHRYMGKIRLLCSCTIKALGGSSTLSSYIFMSSVILLLMETLQLENQNMTSNPINPDPALIYTHLVALLQAATVTAGHTIFYHQLLAELSDSRSKISREFPRVDVTSGFIVHKRQTPDNIDEPREVLLRGVWDAQNKFFFILFAETSKYEKHDLSTDIA
jgi:hypothetical protein